MPSSVRDITITQVVALLTRRFPRENPYHVIETVGQEYDALAGNPIRIFVPNLVEHAARRRLTREPAAAA